MEILYYTHILRIILSSSLHKLNGLYICTQQFCLYESLFPMINCLFIYGGNKTLAVLSIPLASETVSIKL